MLLIEAEAGYGKTTVADLLSAGRLRVWYSLGAADRDPRVFIAHLIAGFGEAVHYHDHRRAPIAASVMSEAAPWPHLLDELIDELDASAPHHWLVLDDYHLVAGSHVDDVVSRLIERLPRSMQIVIVSRREIIIPNWTRSRAYGQIRRIARADLAFNVDETAVLFSAGYGIALSQTQAQLLVEETEGWPIALSLLAQQLIERGLELETLLGELPDNRAAVFAYLGNQVLSAAPEHVRVFLAASCCLEVMNTAACAAVAGSSVPAAAQVLRDISRDGMFCSNIGSGLYRLHHLFREYLRADLGAEQNRLFEGRAATYFRDAGELEQAARHSLRAGQHECAARDLSQLRDVLNRTGRYLTLLSLTDQLPRAALLAHPELLVARSVALRLTSQYRAALAEAGSAQEQMAYQNDRAGLYAGLVAEATVYLDTVQPSAAVSSLARAGLLSRSLGEDERMSWPVLVAENRLNEGRLPAAERRFQKLTNSTDDHARSRLRLLVRQGDLHRARAMMEARAEPDSGRVPHAHREDQALLAWIYALLGNGKRAEHHARVGAELGIRLSSPIITCVCTGRVGLALLSRDEPAAGDAARDTLLASLTLADSISVPRFRAEPLIGLTIHAGQSADIGDALRFGLEAIDILQAAGDRYLTGMAKLAIGIAAGRQAHPSAMQWLADAASHARQCGDAYLPLIADMWQGLLALREDDTGTFAGHARSAMTVTATFALDEVWTCSPWLGLPTLSDRARWLEAATAVSGAERYSRYLLARAAPLHSVPARATSPRRPPRLQVRTFGRFSVRRDGIEVDERLWTRRKAVEIFWLLCIRERHSIGREEAIELLWPEGIPDSANLKFRVALHALRNVLEPDRAPRAASDVVHATPDRLDLTADVELDLDMFRDLAKAAGSGTEPTALLAAGGAIDLYRGPFLADAPYLDWLQPTRGACQATFISLCDRVARAYLDAANYDKAAALARRVIDEDPYHERAYRLLAEAHLRNGDQTAATRAFGDCRRRIVDELGIELGWTIQALRNVGRD
ncbi:MAG: BTAD domain-containing putative transcriptional regulator [Sciscionella sp.]